MASKLIFQNQHHKTQHSIIIKPTTTKSRLQTKRRKKIKFPGFPYLIEINLCVEYRAKVGKRHK
jgi:hypothetical protein